MKQPSLFTLDDEKPIEVQEWGTFKDSLRAPIHNWFTYPAGFSYKAVEASLKAHSIATSQVVYDPFMGTGTTNLTAKKLGINSYGVEAHPFVYRIARTKLNWDIEKERIAEAVTSIEVCVRSQRKGINGNLNNRLKKEFPELILKCYEDRTLFDLLLIREAIVSGEFSPEISDFLFVSLTSLLRQVSTAATGWPYIAPKKQKTTSLGKDALFEFSRHSLRMAQDLVTTRSEAQPDYANSFHRVFNGDSRNTEGLVPDHSIDHVFTSPPYLNNFDYADRTRLELYFFGEAKTWGDITQTIRTKLITSATTQIARDDARYHLSDNLQKACSEVYECLSQSVAKLSKLRLTKGGKKSYDHLVSGYFNDMFMIIADVYRTLKPNTKAVFVLGDSAPYGVHIPTDEFIGKIGLGVGFSDYHIDVLRARGGKWKDNPQRHDVVLRESIVTLRKS
jgi:DNA modification methylase